MPMWINVVCHSDSSAHHIILLKLLIWQQSNYIKFNGIKCMMVVAKNNWHKTDIISFIITSQSHLCLCHLCLSFGKWNRYCRISQNPRSAHKRNNFDITLIKSIALDNYHFGLRSVIWLLLWCLGLISNYLMDNVIITMNRDDTDCPQYITN